VPISFEAFASGFPRSYAKENNHFATPLEKNTVKIQLKKI
jgi:hypothetical protein